MPVIQCPNKHFYDNQKFDECPHCKKNSLQGIPSNVSPSSDGNAHTIAKFADNRDNSNQHTIRKDMSSFTNEGKTESIYFKNKNSNPVSGWLVCVEGENKGKSFDLHIGKNFVGRSMRSDVVINDPHISRENHFSVIFDPNSCKFFVTTGSSVIHLNGDILEHSSELKEDDVIDAGGSKFVFIPFCKEGRDWE